MIFMTVFEQFGTDFQTVCAIFLCVIVKKKNLNNMLVV